VLVVLAIVAVLMTFILPLLGSAKVAANRTKCLSNQRQIGLALTSYANEHDGILPPSMHSTRSWRKEESWVFQIAPYLDNVDEVRVCPSDPPDRQKIILERNATSYVLNDLVVDNAQYRSIYAVPRPSKTLLLGVLSENRTPHTQWDHIHGGQWTSWTAAVNDVEVDRHRAGERSDDRLKGSSNYLYMDGSVKNIPARELKALIDEGINPAEVPTG